MSSSHINAKDVQAQSFSSRLPQLIAGLEQTLDHWLPSAENSPQQLNAAMRYAVLSPGKRIRPLLLYATGSVLQLSTQQLHAAACAVEMIHAYSLIHDDLPAMDDDDLRRGRPTCHKAFDEATAILAGDALQAFAFEVLSCDEALNINSDQRLQMIKRLAIASGPAGMAGGQAIDLAAEGQRLDLSQLETMHRKKTGALIEASVLLAADVAAATAEQYQALSNYAANLGLAFQVHDDVLDVASDTATLGKTSGADAALNKPTYPSTIGLGAAQAMAKTLHDQAITALKVFDAEQAEPLRWLANYIIKREH